VRQDRKEFLKNFISYLPQAFGSSNVHKPFTGFSQVFLEYLMAGQGIIAAGGFDAFLMR
jgi:hypothetical protein